MKQTRLLMIGALGGLAFGGFAAAYVRLVPFWCDGSCQGSGVALALVLAGFALGARAGTRLMRNRSGLPGWSPLLLVVWLAWLALAPFLLPGAIVSGLTKFGGQVPSYGRFILWQAGILSRVLLPIAGLAGMGWMLLRQAGGKGRADLVLAGSVLAGAIMVWSGFLPAWGVETTLRGATLLGALAASLALFASLPPKPRLLGLAGLLPLLLAAWFCLGFRGAAPLLSEQTIGCWIGTQGALVRLPGTIAAHSDGRRHALTLRRFPGGERLLCRDGERRVAQPGDLPTASLAVQLPLMLHAEPLRLALLGVDDGAGLAAATDHPLTIITCAGVERGQLPIIRQMLADGHGREEVLDDPRVSFPAWCPARPPRSEAGRYDVIVSQPGPPWTRSGARMLTQDAFAASRGALATNGILCVALDAQALAPRHLRRIVGSFAAVFPQMQVWSPQFNRYLLIGAAGVLPFDAERLLESLEHRMVMRELSRVGVKALPDLLACLVMTPAGVKRYLAGDADHRPRRLQGPRLAWSVARGRLTPGQNLQTLAEIEAARTWNLDTLQPGGLTPGLFEALQARAMRQMAARAAIMELRANLGSATHDAVMKQARAAAKLNAEDAFLDRLLSAMEQEAAYALARKDYAGAARLYSDVLGVVPERVSALYGVAMADRGIGSKESAYLNLVRAVSLEPEETDCRLALAEVAFALGKEAEALRHYQTILERRTDDPDALIGLAICLGRGKPPIRNVATAIAAAERAARLTRYREPRITKILADLYVENGRVVEGVTLKRRIRLDGR